MKAETKRGGERSSRSAAACSSSERDDPLGVRRPKRRPSCSGSGSRATPAIVHAPSTALRPASRRRRPSPGVLGDSVERFVDLCGQSERSHSPAKHGGGGGVSGSVCGSEHPLTRLRKLRSGSIVQGRLSPKIDSMAQRQRTAKSRRTERQSFLAIASSSWQRRQKAGKRESRLPTVRSTVRSTISRRRSRRSTA